MAIAQEEPLSAYLDRLRAILVRLEVGGGERHDELFEQARVATADVRRFREGLSRDVDAPMGIVELPTAPR